MMNENNDAEIVQRTRFNDKWFCDTYATLVLFEYIHNPDLRREIERVTDCKVTIAGKEMNVIDSFMFSTGPIMLGLNRHIYPVVVRMEEEEF